MAHIINIYTYLYTWIEISIFIGDIQPDILDIGQPQIDFEHRLWNEMNIEKILKNRQNIDNILVWN